MDHGGCSRGSEPRIGHYILVLHRLRPPKPQPGDFVAAASVLMVLIPQVLAYAEVAGMPARLGLVAAALPAIVAAVFVSSPYLQTGPTALTALLVFGSLQPLADSGTEDYVQLGMLLALIVGLTRIALGLLRLGVIAYFLSQPVLTGFTTGAAVLIIGSQIPKVFGVPGQGGRVLTRAADSLSQVGDWNWSSLILASLTAALIYYLKRIHPLFPAVLAAVGVAWILDLVLGLKVQTVGQIDGGLIGFNASFPFSRFGNLILPGLIIALIGFAEPASIARTFAAEKRERWSANQEFVSQGAANLASAFTGSFPVGGSFGRSSLNVAAGAQTRWSGFLTGVLVLLVLPFASVLSTMPSAVLSAVVITAALKLIRVDRIRAMWAWSPPQALSAAVTLVATLAFDPRVDRAILVGVAISIGIHLWRELNVYVEVAQDPHGGLEITPHGVLWFGSITRISQKILDLIADHPESDRVVVFLGGVGRLDLTAAGELAELSVDARRNGVDVRFEGVPPHAKRLFDTIIAPK